jgi:hypothetical protein
MIKKKFQAKIQKRLFEDNLARITDLELLQLQLNEKSNKFYTRQPQKN